MRAPDRRRLAAYAVGAMAVLGLAYAGFVYPRTVDADVATLVNAAEFQERQFGLHREALEYVDRALAQEPDHPYAHVIGAKAAEGLGDWERALAFYRRAETLYPDPARKRDLRVLALRVLVLAGRHEEIETEARTLLAAGDDPVVLSLLGASREARGDLEGALACFRTAIDGGGTAEATFAAAAVLVRLGRREEAIRHLERGLEQDRSRVAAWVSLADLRLQGGDRDGAVEALKAGSALDPIRIRTELRRNPAWIPLQEMKDIADLLAAAPPRARE